MLHRIASAILIVLVVPLLARAETVEEQCTGESGISDFTGQNAIFESEFGDCVRGKESQGRELELRKRSKLHREKRMKSLTERAKLLTERRNSQAGRSSTSQTRKRGMFFDDFPKDTSATKHKEQRSNLRGEVREKEGQILKEEPTASDVATKEALTTCEHLRASMKSLCVRKELLKKRTIRYYKYGK